MGVHILQRLLHIQLAMANGPEKGRIPYTFTGNFQCLADRQIIFAGAINIQQADRIQITAKEPASGFAAGDKTCIE